MYRYNGSQIRKTFLCVVLLACLTIRLGVSSLQQRNDARLSQLHGNRLKRTWQFFKKAYDIKRPIAGNSKTDSLPYDSESSMTAVQIITNRGYPVTSYSVTTDDGYILELHRIPHGKDQSSFSTPYGKPVLLQHGIVGSSVDWLATPTNRSLAFRLADLGYDVWLGNARGNTYSRRHRRLNPRYQQAYWDFSWDEMGKFDIPAVVDFILSETGRGQLIYIGHSMGCTMFFVAISTYPALGSKIELMIGMAPAAALTHMRTPILRVAAPFARPIELMLRLFRVRDFFDYNSRFSYWTQRFCNRNLADARICANQMFLLVGDDPLDITPEFLTLLSNHLPAGTSVRTIVQYALNYNAGQTFRPYDYGLLGNLRRYGQTKPPPYDLSKVTTPIYLFNGATDLLVTPKDVAWLASQLPNVKGSFLVNSDYYNHVDFLFHEKNNELVYDQVIALLPSPNTD